MKNFIKKLEDRGTMEIMVKSAISTEKIAGRPVSQIGLEMFLEKQMEEDEELEDIFLQEAHYMAMKSVFEYMQKKIEERKEVEASNRESLVEKPKDREEVIEDIILSSFSRVVDDVLKDILKNMMDDLK